MSREIIDLSLVCLEGPVLLKPSPEYSLRGQVQSHEALQLLEKEPLSATAVLNEKAADLQSNAAKSEPQLTAEQTGAIDKVMESLKRDTVLIALTGPAGCGKTTMIRELSKRLEDNVVITALTNKAADVLRRKNLAAKTVHAACLTPVYREPGASLNSYLFMEEVDEDTEKYLRTQFNASKLERARKMTQKYGLNSGALVLGIKDFLREYLLYWGIKTKGEEVLIVDEASMLDAEILGKIQSCHSKIILVGDEFQIPPFKNLPVLDNDKVVDIRIELSEIHRQTKDSKPFLLSQDVRRGKTLPIEPIEPIDLAMSKLGTPIIVWTNQTRISITKKIRQALGYHGSRPRPGEPIVCGDSSTIDDTEFAKNTLWSVESITDDGECFLVSTRGQRTKAPVRLWMEEYGAGSGLICRFGYVLTCHTAQGSEWPTIMIHAHEAEERIRSNRKEGLRWLYTAITRAKQDIKWVNSEVSD